MQFSEEHLNNAKERTLLKRFATVEVLNFILPYVFDYSDMSVLRIVRIKSYYLRRTSPSLAQTRCLIQDSACSQFSATCK